jgi:hypothetical protein
MTQSSSVETLLEQGHNLLDRVQEQAALEIFQQAATLEPQNHRVLYALGLASYRLESYQNSIEPEFGLKRLRKKPLHLKTRLLRLMAISD